MSPNIIMPNKASEEQQQQQQKHKFHLRFLSCLSKQRTGEETQKKTHVNNVNIDVCVCVCVFWFWVNIKITTYNLLWRDLKQG